MTFSRQKQGLWSQEQGVSNLLLHGKLLLGRRQGRHQKAIPEASLEERNAQGPHPPPPRNDVLLLLERKWSLLGYSLKSQLCLEPVGFPFRLSVLISTVIHMSSTPRSALWGVMKAPRWVITASSPDPSASPVLSTPPRRPSQDRHTEPGAELFKGEVSLPLHIHPVKDHLQLILAAQEAELGRLQE